jgi:hypothetical protein
MDVSSFGPGDRRLEQGPSPSAISPDASVLTVTDELSGLSSGDSRPPSTGDLVSRAGASERFPSAQLVPTLSYGPVAPAQPSQAPSGNPSFPDEEELSSEDDLEIDPRTDPLHSTSLSSVADWEVEVQKIIPRQPMFEDPVEQEKRVRTLLEKSQNVDLRLDPTSQAEAEALLASLPHVLRDPEQFVAGSFTSCHAAWSALLEKSNRKSSKTVLGWL